MSQLALAKSVDLTRASIANIEKGRQRLLVHKLVEIANVLGVETADLIPNLNEEDQLPDDLNKSARNFVESAIKIATSTTDNHDHTKTKNKKAR